MNNSAYFATGKMIVLKQSLIRINVMSQSQEFIPAGDAPGSDHSLCTDSWEIFTT